MLRRNCRVESNSKTPGNFNISTYGSHHIRLISAIADAWNKLLGAESAKGVGGSELIRMPTLREVKSGEQFGLVTSNHTLSFQGLLEIKQEDPDDLLEVLDDTAAATADAAADTDTDTDNGGKMASNIDPGLLDIPVAVPSGSYDIPSTLRSSSVVLANPSPSKRKASYNDDLQESGMDPTISKKARMRSSSIAVTVSP